MLTKSFWTKWMALIFSFIILASCGGGGGGGNPDPAPDPGTGEGDSTHPVSLTVGVQHNGSIGLAGVSYYYFNTGSAGGGYTISLTNTSKILAWYLYSDATYTTQVDSCAAYASGDKVCFANLNAGVNYYLKVYSFSITSSSTYTVTVTTGGGNEGSAGAPVPLTIGTPRSATVSFPGDSYYSFAPASTGSFIISLTNTNTDLGWMLYSDATFTTQMGSTCDKSWQVVDEICSTSNLTSGSTYYLKVHNDGYTDDSFMLNVEAGKSEGSVAGPVALTVGAEHIGAIDAYSNFTYGYSYYKFTTSASATSSYVISLSDAIPASGTLGMAVYSDPAFTTTQQYCSASPCSLSNLNPSTTYYVRTSNANSTSYTYKLTVTAGGSEGSTSSPVNLTIDTQHNGGVDVSGGSYYSFTTNSGAGGSYTISLTGTQADVSWTLYADSAFSYSLWSCNTVQASGPGDESCATTNLDASKTYYLKVSNNDTTSTSYTATVTAGGGSEGSQNNPMVLPIGTTHDGTVLGSGYSYYSMTTGGSKISYLIGLTNTQTDLGWSLYSEAGFIYTVNSCNAKSGTGDEKCSTSLLEANKTYYLRVNNNASSFGAYSVGITPLDPAAGCSGGAAECFNFEDGQVPISFTLTSPSNKPSTKWDIDGFYPAGNGTKSIRSGSIVNGESTCFEYTRVADTGSVLFSLKTDTDYWNQLIFTIDGIQKGWWNSSNVWQRVIYFVETSGSHTFKWCYTKTTGFITGADTVWVDDIEFK